MKLQFGPPQLLSTHSREKQTTEPGESGCAVVIEGSQIVLLTTQGAYSPLAALSRNLNRYVRQASPDGVTAVNTDGGAGDKIGSPGRQKDSGPGAFIGITETAGWRPRKNFLVQQRWW
jgi:hypothetical protein